MIRSLNRILRREEQQLPETVSNPKRTSISDVHKAAFTRESILPIGIAIASSAWQPYSGFAIPKLKDAISMKHIAAGIGWACYASVSISSPYLGKWATQSATRNGAPTFKEKWMAAVLKRNNALIENEATERAREPSANATFDTMEVVERLEKSPAAVKAVIDNVLDVVRAGAGMAAALTGAAAYTGSAWYWVLPLASLSAAAWTAHRSARKPSAEVDEAPTKGQLVSALAQFEANQESFEEAVTLAQMQLEKTKRDELPVFRVPTVAAVLGCVAGAGMLWGVLGAEESDLSQAALAAPFVFKLATSSMDLIDAFKETPTAINDLAKTRVNKPRTSRTLHEYETALNNEREKHTTTNDLLRAKQEESQNHLKALQIKHEAEIKLEREEHRATKSLLEAKREENQGNLDALRGERHQHKTTQATLKELSRRRRQVNLSQFEHGQLKKQI